MNRRKIINKILHDHIDVNKNEDYTNYKKLITAIEEWHENEVKNLPISRVVGSEAELPNTTLEQAIEKAKPNMDKITDVDKHLDDIR